MTTSKTTAKATTSPETISASDNALSVDNLTVTYRRTRGLLGKTKQVLHAVNGVSLNVARGEVVGLVGESGSGKSTIAQAIERLVPIDDGAIYLNGEEITHLRGKQLRATRRGLQMVFQDPYSSLDPSMTIYEILKEPLLVHRICDKSEFRERVEKAVDDVGLARDTLTKYPHEFSGGQRQRIAIARALITDPDVVILDEAVSALDVSTRGQILKLLQELRQKVASSYLFIGHDLAVVRKVSDRIAVMYLGRIVEVGPSEEVVSNPRHPYTAGLLAAVPDPRPGAKDGTKPPLVTGDPPDPWNPPAGCAFASRCPFAMDVCHEIVPEPFKLEHGGSAACHLHTSGPTLDGGPLPVQD